MLIEVKSLKISMGDFGFVVPSWSLPDQSHLLLEGPSGTGKTTFLHLLAGLVPFKEGEIKIGHTALKDLSHHDLVELRKNKFGIIFQKIHLLPHLNLRENILMGCKNADQVLGLNSLIKSLNLENRLEHLPSALSLGETQRAAVARALISQPELILADEPTSGLDDSNAEQVIGLLKNFGKNKTLIVVSHDARVRKHFDNKIDFRELLK